ncbi:MAG: 3-oxoacyl-[acyl-carrier-protein] reductase [Coriobacteriales bacterium]|jgi:3-oxoacyl-[acyl-carrier protein] reductase|nr:3-oxoacyl-[acyl-carrier-protein] reductase [Coriobacteriales bacterium]
MMSSTAVEPLTAALAAATAAANAAKDSAPTPTAAPEATPTAADAAPSDAAPRRVALVTGGSGGIGRAICVALAAQGCDVAIAYTRQSEKAAATAASCRTVAAAAGFYNTRFIGISGDVANRKDCELIFAATTEQLGAPDILVNNAGITRDNLVLRMSVEDFDAVLDVNLRAAFILSRLAARQMIRRRFGRIINIASVVGLTGNAGQANYAASKAGLIGLTRSLARELGSRQVTVNAVAPGFIQTRMTAELDDKRHEELLGSLSIKRVGHAEDVAAAVAFLAGAQASYITGQVLAVDGGMTMQ